MATKLHAGQPKSKITFDIDRELKCGLLRKQGGAGTKSLKQRFFVLYQNFLVYYDDQTKWQYDKTVGHLQSRRGAIKLKGGRTSKPMSYGVPSECAFAFVVHAPDPTNKKPTYLLDAKSLAEREAWIEAITKATPPNDDKKK